jgi:hypothetical protein
MRLKLPKVNFIFDEYFFKAVIGSDAFLKIKGWVQQKSSPRKRESL